MNKNKKTQKIIKEAVKISSDYNFWDKHSMRFALRNVQRFLIENFDLEENKNGR